MQRQWRPWISTRLAADIEEFGCGDQEAAIADVQRHVVTVRSGETVPMNSTLGESHSNRRR